MSASLRRIWGLVYRHLALYGRSWPRLLELAYWPVLQMCIWGFTSAYLMTRQGFGWQAAGALIGGALASQPRYAEPYYYDDGYAPAPRPVYRQRYVYQGGLEPWTPAWYRYCSNRYRSFDGRTGTFVGYDGAEHFCVAN